MGRSVMMKSERIARLEKHAAEVDARELAMLALIRTIVVTLGQHHAEGVKEGVAAFIKGAVNGLHDLSNSNSTPEIQEALQKEAEGLIRGWLKFDPLSSNSAPMQ
jgi:hypothetical protein